MSSTSSKNDLDQAPPSPLTSDQLASKYVELWKKTVEVQQHFNDLEWRIRGLALTAATFALGASAVAAKDGTVIGGVSLGTGVLILGVVLWYAFYFVDRYWYHSLLIGSVKHGSILEAELRRWLPKAGLTDSISEGSPELPPLALKWTTAHRKEKRLRSTDKMVVFYSIGGFVLIVAAISLQVAANLTPTKIDEIKTGHMTETVRQAPPTSSGLDSAPATPGPEPIITRTPVSPTPALPGMQSGTEAVPNHGGD
ncbi:Uncharacterised protein [Mycobacteroides abscessus subsp. abscessus]|uniref:Transmembrane protein n=1 Tax=Mycobacteroides abscessus TaxID=36809 RepID=A0AB33T6N1_9MYCO|nr:MULTISPECIES: hypothetical protein [Mycobacteriaceae]MDO3017398.1 hypothetical protein [Mycobacteroides abscessus subsp. abscessus]MDO3083402.1 hypothetical protein [Mycobacteroides abscessus subsp. abscessus]CPT42965.1 Uncharacterised protein [Mycobacteroides abscessus]CPT44640.1 Uncharacterised protein [Mycobacteroides abscessus]CPT54517.1 Uncharacterised protein [Mycobacteroides abscessus]